MVGFSNKDDWMTGGAGTPDHGPAERATAGQTQQFTRLILAGAAFAGAFAAVLVQGSGSSFILPVLAALACVGLVSIANAIIRFGLARPQTGDEMSRLLVAATSDGVAVVEDGEQISSANTPYLRLTRSREGQAPIPERFLQRIPGGQAMLAEILHAVAEGTSCTRMFPFDADPDGRKLRVSVHPLGGRRRTMWVLSVTGAERSEATAVVQAAAVPAGPADAAVTEHSAAAGLLALWERAPLGMFVLTSEEAWLANGALARLLGYDLAEVGAGRMSFREIIPPSSAGAMLAALTKGRSDPDGLDIDVLRRDGSTLPVRAFVGGLPMGECVVVLAPRARAAAAAPSLAAPVARGSDDAAFFSRSPLAMATIDARGRLTEANGSFARLFSDGRTLTGLKLERLVVERDQVAVEQLVQDALRDGASGAAQAVDIAIAAEGGRSARLYAAALGGPGGGAAIYAVDTTAQRALEVQFAQSQKMQAIGQLAGGVAHDFNNVLTAIIGYCDLLLASHRPSDPSFPDIMQIKQNANRAAGLVRQLLAFSRRQTLRPQVIQLTDVISDLSMLLRRLIGETITLEVEHGRDLWPVKVDVNQFEQVIVNLAVNARDAMPGGGALTLRTRNVTAAETAALGDGTVAPGDYVLVEVVDTGTGIPPEIMDKIFEPFFSTKEVGKGTGLGLSTVYGIVQQTGGTILAASTPGAGTTFRVFLPRHAEEAAQVEARPAEPDTRTADLTGQGSVLLVEDEDAVRAFASRALSARGYNVVAASGGAEALAVVDAAEHRFDLVISDVVMPEMDGPTLLRELRARHPELKVIFISGYAEEAFAKNLPASEKFAFLPKPFTLKQLVAAVKETIAS
ncbi:two-component system cell cycle sensor histidine kinase/response regulator CckA [Azorhizobium sp. AG788]|nr:two-component system cell cycle sensor histidine kinase/response regulator CckA [Azorhizobium sp. AG788]